MLRQVPDGGFEYAQVESRNIKVGDIVFVSKGELFPSDLVALASSEDEGVCFVETSNLDGYVLWCS